MHNLKNLLTLIGEQSLAADLPPGGGHAICCLAQLNTIHRPALELALQIPLGDTQPMIISKGAN
eukprot:3442518-Karenia_brevis.AAC.1